MIMCKLGVQSYFDVRQLNEKCEFLQNPQKYHCNTKAIYQGWGKGSLTLMIYGLCLKDLQGAMLMNRGPIPGLQNTESHTFVSSIRMTSISSHLNKDCICILYAYTSYLKMNEQSVFPCDGKNKCLPLNEIKVGNWLFSLQLKQLEKRDLKYLHCSKSFVGKSNW